MFIKKMPFNDVRLRAEIIASDFTSVLDLCNPESPTGQLPIEKREERIYYLLKTISIASKNLFSNLQDAVVAERLLSNSSTQK